VQVRDRPYTEAHINDSPGTQAAFDNYLAPLTAFLQHVGGQSIRVSRHIESPAVYVFLRQELDRRSGKTTLTDAMVDALVVWALEGTDPDQGKFLSRSKILEHVVATLPAVRQIVEERLDVRLEALAAKDYPGGRGIRWHKKEDLFALPYEARQLLADENAEDEALRIAVREGFEERLRDQLGDSLGVGTPETAALVALRSVELMFESEGLEFAQFVTGKVERSELPTVSDAVARAMDDLAIPKANRVQVDDAVLETLRIAFHGSSDEERLFFERLARTYSLLFTLQADPGVVRYFEELAGDFYLYVGADILVRALSERYLQPKDQVIRNTLAMAREAGATLVLT
jgi:hypothetical protein